MERTPTQDEPADGPEADGEPTEGDVELPLDPTPVDDAS